MNLLLILSLLSLMLSVSIGEGELLSCTGSQGRVTGTGIAAKLGMSWLLYMIAMSGRRALTDGENGMCWSRTRVTDARSCILAWSGHEGQAQTQTRRSNSSEKGNERSFNVVICLYIYTLLYPFPHTRGSDPIPQAIATISPSSWLVQEPIGEILKGHLCIPVWKAWYEWTAREGARLDNGTSYFCHSQWRIRLRKCDS